MAKVTTQRAIQSLQTSNVKEFAALQSTMDRMSAAQEAAAAAQQQLVALEAQKVAIQKEQLHFQRIAAVQAQTQTSLMEMQSLRSARQRQLKDAAYRLRKMLPKLETLSSSLDRVLAANWLAAVVDTLGLQPDELEEFRDKEVVEEILALLQAAQERHRNQLSNEESGLLDFFGSQEALSASLSDRVREAELRRDELREKGKSLADELKKLGDLDVFQASLERQKSSATSVAWFAGACFAVTGLCLSILAVVIPGGPPNDLTSGLFGGFLFGFGSFLIGLLIWVVKTGEVKSIAKKIDKIEVDRPRLTKESKLVAGEFEAVEKELSDLLDQLSEARQAVQPLTERYPLLLPVNIEPSLA